MPAHHLFVDVFCGALGFFLNRPPSKLKVINDINGDLVNFFRCVRYHHEELLRELAWAVNAHTDFDDYKRQPGLTDIQKAARWFMVLKCSFASGGGAWAVQRKSGGAGNSSLDRKRRLIESLAQRLDRVAIENRDWQRCVELYDAPETLFFLDPPYTNCDQGNYRSWKDDEIRSLAGTIGKLKGSFVLTVNDSEANRQIFGMFKTDSIARPRGIANKVAGDRKLYRELIIRPV